MPEKTQSTPLLSVGQYIVEKVVELNFFDLTGERASTKGTSSKSYHVELCLSKTDTRAQIYTMWGATGSRMTEDWRYYDTHEKARKEFESIIKSKIRKGYKEIDVAQRANGSDEAKQITKAVSLKNITTVDDKQIIKQSVLHKETQRLIAKIMNVTQEFVTTTLKCPLGILTASAIDSGQDRLDQAKIIVNQYIGKTVPDSGPDYNKLLDLTNEFYSLIPHNLGSGSRGKMEHLLLNDTMKIAQKEADLDTLLDAKSIGAVLKTGSNVDDQYNTLNTDVGYLDGDDPMFNYIAEYFIKSRVKQHGFNNDKVKHIWKIARHGNERENFNTVASSIAKECKSGHTYVKDAGRLYDTKQFGPEKRTDINDGELDLYKKSNTWLCWHGSKLVNFPGIIKNSLMIRPSGVVLTGALYGAGIYAAHQSSKSLNYFDGGYWTGGNRQSQKYLFLMETIMGDMHLASGQKYYTTAPKGYHSVYGKANHSGVMNDEMIVYNSNQIKLSYLVEIE